MTDGSELESTEQQSGPASDAVSETGGPSGYSFSGFSGDCDAAGSVRVVPDQTRTCTLTNDDRSAHLTLVKQGTPLAEVRGPYNAIRVVGDAVGDTLFYGRGAGMLPTASAAPRDGSRTPAPSTGTSISASSPALTAAAAAMAASPLGRTPG